MPDNFERGNCDVVLGDSADAEELRWYGDYSQENARIVGTELSKENVLVLLILFDKPNVGRTVGHWINGVYRDGDVPSMKTSTQYQPTN